MIDADHAQQLFGEAIQQALNPFTLAACVMAAFFGLRTFLGVTALCALATLAYHIWGDVPDAGVASAAAVAGQGAFGRLLVAPFVIGIASGIALLLFGRPGEAAAPEAPAVQDTPGDDPVAAADATLAQTPPAGGPPALSVPAIAPLPRPAPGDPA